jgi:polyvinyl alcohol dehydrogenase (cytochrome)
MSKAIHWLTLAVGFLFAIPPIAIQAGEDGSPTDVTQTRRTDTKDWPMYNCDLIGTRHNRGETAISKANAGQLEEKWRFPAKGSKELIGVIHTTPVVVDGYVYFGTATDPAFYKLTPDGKVCWSYRRVARPESLKSLAKQTSPSKTPGLPVDLNDAAISTRFRTSPDGIFASALVSQDTVFFGDLGGWLYALDRTTGAERWKLNSRIAPFPDAHMLNCFFASPILADGKLILGGGAIEQVAAAFPGYRGCNGRGFVMALEPKTGRILWNMTSGRSPSASIHRSPSRIVGARTLSITGLPPAPCGVRLRSTRKRARFSSAPTQTILRAGPRPTILDRTRASRAPSLL